MRYTPADIARLLGQKFSPTDEQADVISAPPGPLLVIAGAGAGKTETMAARVVWLVANGYVYPDQILGLTFTRKAAQQLGQRIRQRLQRLAASPDFTGSEADQIRHAIHTSDPDTATYDSYAGTILRSYGLLLPVETTATIVNAAELSEEAVRLVSQWPHPFAVERATASVVNDLLGLRGEMANHMVDSATVRDENRCLREGLTDLPKAKRARADLTKDMRDFLSVCEYRDQLLDLIDLFDNRMREMGCLDFGQQMAYAAELALTHPQVGLSERAHYRVVLLDEYQDTGYAQRVFLRSLFGNGQDPTLSVTAVGDPIQSIYGWRGASATNLAHFRTDFPAVTTQDDTPQGGTTAHEDSTGAAVGTASTDTLTAQPAPVNYLLTSWRNPGDILSLASTYTHRLSAATRNAIAVPDLRPAPNAADADIHCRYFGSAEDEYAWIARYFRSQFDAAAARGELPPTSAVLVTRNRDSLPMAEALEAAGVPAEIVNVGGLLSIPEVQDVWAMLRIIADPLDGGAALRILTGPRLNLGASDLRALWGRARELRGDLDPADDTDPTTLENLLTMLQDALPQDAAAQVGIADAIDDPGPADRYSPAGYTRLQQLRADVRHLRKRLGQPLPELIAEVERTIGVDVEVEARLDPGAGHLTGRHHLDAFADAVASFCRGANPSLGSLLAYLQQAAESEGGLAPGTVTVRRNCVQIITIFGAKGLEWECVAIPNLSQREFPPARGRTNWVKTAAELPANLRGDTAVLLPGAELPSGIPTFSAADATDRSEYWQQLAQHLTDLKAMELEEKLRLMYVAVTRTERSLLLTGHGWSYHDITFHEPSEYLRDAYQWAETIAVDYGADADIFPLLSYDDQTEPTPPHVVTTHQRGTLTIHPYWVAAPAKCITTPKGELVPDPAFHPLTARDASATWPVDHLADSPHIRQVHTALHQAVESAGRPAGGQQTSPLPATAAVQALAQDADVLLAEYLHQQAGDDPTARTVTLPTRLTASQIVALREDPEDFARRLRRPIPFKPNRYARRGTDFHTWVEHHLSGDLGTLVDLEEIMDARDDIPEPVSLTRLKETFAASSWAQRTTSMVEVPFDVSLGSVVINGRIDAVFRDDADHYTVVDWKTGAIPRTTRDRTTKALQLATYRIAFHRIINVQRAEHGQPPLPLGNIRAAFYYVAHDYTLWLDELADSAELERLIGDLTTSTADPVEGIPGNG